MTATPLTAQQLDDLVALIRSPVGIAHSRTTLANETLLALVAAARESVQLRASLSFAEMNLGVVGAAADEQCERADKLEAERDEARAALAATVKLSCETLEESERQLAAMTAERDALIRANQEQCASEVK